jgi:hypothetical protein
MRFSTYIPLTLLFLTSAVSALIIPSDATLTPELHPREPLADGDILEALAVRTPPQAPQLPRSPAPPKPQPAPPYKVSQIGGQMIITAVKKADLWLKIRSSDKQLMQLENPILDIVEAFKMPDGIIISALIYLKRVEQMNPNANGSPDSVMRIVISTIIIAYKMHNDAVPRDYQWAEAARQTRMTAADITTIQVQTMKLLKYELHISVEEFNREARKNGVIMRTPLREPSKAKEDKMENDAKKAGPSTKNLLQ